MGFVIAIVTWIAAPETATCDPPVDPEEPFRTGLRHLLETQEGVGRVEWPYEGVYRVRREIPIGYRVGGTAICGTSILRAPPSSMTSACDEALDRAVRFVVASIEHDEMAHSFRATYDVRGWGYTYGLSFLLALRADERVPDGLREEVDGAIRFFIRGLEETEIPTTGGWNYSRPRGFDASGPSSPFMTAPSLLALYEARRQGYDVATGMVDRGLDALAASRTALGTFVYAGEATDRRSSETPGSCARMAAAETALFLGGRGSLERMRAAVDAFIVHWRWLEERRARDGTHEPPYGIAPYYFYFGHYYAGLAAELLPDEERQEYRRRVREIVMQSRADDGTWNDRVFARSAAYGTSMAMLTLALPASPPPAGWPAPPAEATLPVK